MVECLEFRIENSNPIGPDSGSLKLHIPSSPLHYGKFVFPQLKKGQGITLANSLRRVLLYDVGGLGITHLRARMKKFPSSPSSSSARNLNNQNEALHEFSSIPGMRESVLELLVNLRAVVWKSSVAEPPENKTTKFGENTNSSDTQEQFLGKIHTFSFNKKKILEAAQKIHSGGGSFILQAKHLGNEHIVDPDQYLATILLAECPDFEIDYILGASCQSMNPAKFSTKTSGTSEESFQNEEFQSIWLPTDGNFFPVKKVNYSIEESGTGIGSTSGSSSVGNIPYSETVFLEIWTNGGSHPQESLNQALRILIKLFGG
jgi:DNA-directed RNA polymerase subunit alpha